MRDEKNVRELWRMRSGRGKRKSGKDSKEGLGKTGREELGG